jgi:hypothetical protein
MTNRNLTTKPFHDIQSNRQKNEQAGPVCQIDQIFVEECRHDPWQWQQQRIGNDPWQQSVNAPQCLDHVCQSRQEKHQNQFLIIALSKKQGALAGQKHHPAST